MGFFKSNRPQSVAADPRTTSTAPIAEPAPTTATTTAPAPVVEEKRGLFGRKKTVVHHDRRAAPVAATTSPVTTTHHGRQGSTGNAVANNGTLGGTTHLHSA